MICSSFTPVDHEAITGSSIVAICMTNKRLPAFTKFPSTPNKKVEWKYGSQRWLTYSTKPSIKIPMFQQRKSCLAERGASLNPLCAFGHTRPSSSLGRSLAMYFSLKWNLKSSNALFYLPFRDLNWKKAWKMKKTWRMHITQNWR